MDDHRTRSGAPIVDRSWRSSSWSRGYAPGIGPQLDDAQLVAAAQGGDRFALDRLLRRHYDRIHAVTTRIAGRTRDADDACQEALIKIVRSLPAFDGRSSFGTWAYRIATNAAIDEVRRRRRRPDLHLVDGDDDRAPIEAIDPVAERRVEGVADRLAIDEALEQLPDEFREAVILRDVGDLDYAEIAEVLGIAIGTVKSRIARGRRLLVDLLDVEPGPTSTAPTDPHAVTRGTPDGGNPTAPSERPTDPT